MPTFDLSKTVEDVNGNPMFGDPDFIFPKDGEPQPVEIKATGQTIEDAVAILKRSDPLTYRQLIFRALLADVNPQQAPKMPNKEDRAILSRKIELNKTDFSAKDDIPMILKSAEHAPQITTEQYMRLMVFLGDDPADEGDPEEEKRAGD